MNYYLPIVLIVLSNIFYNVSSKSTPEKLNPFAGLTLTYLVGALCSAVLYFCLNRGGNLLAEYQKINWSTLVLGLSIVGLEAGSIYMYKAGWSISTGHLVHGSILAICLIAVGALFYREPITLRKVLGALVCIGGLFLING